MLFGIQSQHPCATPCNVSHSSFPMWRISQKGDTERKKYLVLPRDATRNVLDQSRPTQKLGIYYMQLWISHQKAQLLYWYGNCLIDSVSEQAIKESIVPTEKDRFSNEKIGTKRKQEQQLYCTPVLHKSEWHPLLRHGISRPQVPERRKPKRNCFCRFIEWGLSAIEQRCHSRRRVKAYRE